ncbi:terminase large subunit [Rhodobacteraceae phage LS06-2018-MD05]|nr:terminase large subunit [Rhodobacteraceae phage LS06-2018-MD05]
MAGLKMKYFVLKPEGNDIYAEASRMAMREYANTIASVNIEFATEIKEWVTAIDPEREQENELLPDVRLSYLDKAKADLVISEEKLAKCIKYSKKWHFYKKHIEWLNSEINELE